MPLELIPPEEQFVRKKAEEKLSVSRIHKEPPRIPKMIALEKEIRPGSPIIPEDPCCAKLCKILNDNIEQNRDTLNSIIYIGGKKIYKNILYRSLVYQIEALEEHRQYLKDKNICGCVTNTGAVSARDLIKEHKETGGIVTREIEFAIPSPKRLERTHLREKSITPPTNSCCPESCKILNKDIDLATKILDKMEIRGGYEATKNPRYEAWSSKVTALQDYRMELKNKGSCKCFEQ